MKLRLGFSPCPNDTFIFDALVHERIDNNGFQFEVIMEDVETLNLMALEGKLEITKLSYHALAYCLQDYRLLKSGSALGRNCGPLFIYKNDISGIPLNTLRVGIPGQYTTAHFLLQFAYPQITNKIVLPFHLIEREINQGNLDAGVIIHENRFTYEERGFRLISDLGANWEVKTRHPIPLGGIAVKKELGNTIANQINILIQKSISYAYQNPANSLAFIRNHAQEMSEEVMQKHIHLYVNEFSKELGDEGEKAVLYFLSTLGQTINPFL